MSAIDLTINGDRRRIPSPLTVADFLDREGLAQRKVAVERNGQIVPRSRHAEVWLAEGDRIEVVVAVGGG